MKKYCKIFLFANGFQPIILTNFIIFNYLWSFQHCSLCLAQWTDLKLIIIIFRLLEQWQWDAIHLCGESPRQLNAAMKKKLIMLCKLSASPKIYACSHQCRSFTLSLIRRIEMDVRDSLSELLEINNVDFFMIIYKIYDK